MIPSNCDGLALQVGICVSLRVPEFHLRVIVCALSFKVHANAKHANATQMPKGMRNLLFFMKLNSAHKYAHIFQSASVSQEQRLEMATLASRECRRVLHFMLRCGMPVKAPQVHRLTIGLLFLMKRGITHHSPVLLRKLPGIHILLPAKTCS
jgi:hypothetical protein